MAGSNSHVRSTALWLFVFFVAALTLRIAFNVGTGFDDDSQRHLLTGNDPYYHWRSLTHVLDTGSSLTFDPGINYPDGGYNPNPPLYVWTAAPIALVVEAVGGADPAGTAINIMTGFWGALTVLPVFILARDLWGRRTALWAGFFVAVSAPHIQRSVWGYADHDSISMFFITLAFMFLVKGLRALKARDYIPTWTSANIGPGIKAAFSENRNAFMFAVLAGISLSAVALVWKGYPYALAVIAVALAVQLLADHMRGKDSTALWAVYLVPLVLVIALPYLAFYRSFPIFLGSTIIPSIMVLLGAIVIGLVLVPTRRIPSIVVIPGLILAGVLGLVGMYFFLPVYFNTIFSGLGYFQQSKLYTTIAEAQRSQLGFVAASFGFFAFLISFWGFGKAVKQSWKGDAAFTLIAAWGVVAFFMAFAASRFIMNAVPVYSLFVAVALTTIFARLGIDGIRRRFNATRGQGIMARAGKSLTWKSGIGTALVAAFLILPSAWIGVDAAMSSEFESKHGLTGHKVDRFGAFGIGFELKGNGWLDTMEYLAAQDTGMAEADRPAFMAWWDYGHWATGIGKHPTVADPFQNHYELAGRFLASESEAEAQNWITVLFLNYDLGKNGGSFSPAVRQAIEAQNPDLLSYKDASGYDAQYDVLAQYVAGTSVFSFHQAVSEATGKSVGYMAADIRMYPFGARNSGIFYAPVYLANKNPDEFLALQIQAATTTLTVKQYAFDADGNSYRLPVAKYVDNAGTEWVIENGYAYRPGQTPANGYAVASGLALSGASEQLVPTQKFFNSMFRRAYGGPTSATPAGDGLEHWRLVQQTISGNYGFADGRLVALLQYYNGAQVSGRVVDTNGAPMSGMEVTFVDGHGASHAVSMTDADGRYTVIAPFSQNNDLKLSVRSGGQSIAERTDVQISVEEARAGASRMAPDIVVAPATVTGRVFENRDATSGYNSSTDFAISGATVSVGGVSTTTNAEGLYTLANVPAGSRTVTVTATGYNDATSSVFLPGGETTNNDVVMTAKTSTVTLRFLNGDGTGIGQVPMTITGSTLASPRTVTTNSAGEGTLLLPAGSYQVKVDHTVTVDGTPQTYKADQQFTVAVGVESVTVTVNRQ